MTTIEDHALSGLTAGFAGQVLRSGDDGYNATRAVYNAMFDRKPAVIARCANTEDVAKAVNFGREHGLLMAVKCGGHSIAGFSSVDDGLLIDLSLMRGVEVDPEKRVARVQGGALHVDVDGATQVHGLATPLGQISTTGVGGLTLNGGFGYLSRLHGLSCDNLIGSEVVLADGSVVRASDDENADLMWGLRGGGGNFGIVTRFEFRLHEVSQVVGWMRLYEPEHLPDILRLYAEAGPGSPEEVLSYVGTTFMPPMDMFPTEVHNKSLAMVFAASMQPDEGTARETMAPLFLDAPHPFELFMPMPYQMAQMTQDAAMPPGLQNYWKSSHMNDLSADAIDTFVEWSFQPDSPTCYGSFGALGGAIGRVGESETAYPGRHARFDMSIDNIWENRADNERQIAHTRSFFDAMRPYLCDEQYLNFNAAESPDEVRTAFGGNYERLVKLKDHYDPGNLFRLNQNIKPSGS
jgi:hypothetical protein